MSLLDNLVEFDHFMPCNPLPPVGSPLIIRIPRGSAMGFCVLEEDWVVRAERTAHVDVKTDLLAYRLDNGMVIQGRFDWTHP